MRLSWKVRPLFLLFLVSTQCEQEIIRVVQVGAFLFLLHAVQVFLFISLPRSGKEKKGYSIRQFSVIFGDTCKYLWLA